MRGRWLFWGQKLIERDPWVLAPLGWIWGAISLCRNWLYDRNFFKAHKVPCTVVSVGNLVAGGTGKTPFVHLLASQFSHRKVAICSRGYGAVADEALLLQRRLPSVQVYVGKDRVALARQAAKEGAELILLDDGFQHRRLHRDFDLVLLSSADPYGRGHFLPRGFLRDSPRRLKQADAVFMTGKDLQVVPGRIFDLQGREISSIRGCKVGLFCGIAKPALFKKTVEGLGARVEKEWFYADHGVPRGIEAFAEECKSLGVKCLICTEKDFVKLPPRLEGALPIYALEISLTIVKRRAVWEKLVEKIDQTIDNSLHV